MTVASAQQHLAELILTTVAFALQAVISLLPGATVALVVYTAYTKRDQLTRKSWGLLMALLMSSAVLWAYHVRISAAGEVAPPKGGARTEAMVPGPVHSGEAVCTADGRFITLPDPTKPEGAPVENGWQKGLATAMTDAIRLGQEQVVLVFSRQGCPWCERLKPVLYRAIQSRAKEIEAAGGEMAPAGAAFLGGGMPMGVGLTLAPLRIFVLDAGEFPYLAQQFRIEAFPTSMFFGQPGATPLVAQGFLNDEQLEEILRAAAVAEPPTEGQRPRRKRRGLFR